MYDCLETTTDIVSGATNATISGGWSDERRKRGCHVATPHTWRNIRCKLRGLQTIVIFTRESSYCFQRVLTFAILSVRLSVCLSHGWISQKRWKLESPNLHRRLPGRL